VRLTVGKAGKKMARKSESFLKVRGKQLFLKERIEQLEAVQEK